MTSLQLFSSLTLGFILTVFIDRGTCQTPGVLGTIGGNANRKNCVFPFLYRGLIYTTCITNNNQNVPWCATSGNYDVNKEWGVCVLTLAASRTKKGNANGANCAFPFIYKNVQYFTCTTVDHATNKPWCATSSNFDIDKVWAECVVYPLVQTTGGNSDNASCTFPYRFGGQEISGCLQDNIRGNWCSTTNDFDRDGRWGQCLLSYSGCTNSYQTVTNQLSYNGVGQPSAQSVVSCQQLCDDDATCVGLDYDNNNELTTRCFLHKEPNNFSVKNPATRVDQYILINRCSGGVVTFGGNAGTRGNVCVFPYRYRGRLYTTCNSANWYGPWCAATDNYDANKIWGECANIPTA